MNANYQNDLAAVYESVINDVIDGCREMFADERVDETVLDELKSAWRQRMIDLGALPSGSNRVGQQNATYMPTVAQKMHPSLISGQGIASGSRVQAAAPQMSGYPGMVVGQQRISSNVSQAAFIAQSTAIRSQLNPNVTGIVGAQSLMQQQPNQGRNVISAVIVPVTKTSANSDLKSTDISRRVQLDGRYDTQASSSNAPNANRGGTSREPPEKRFARGGPNGPISDESDVSDSDIVGLDEFAAVDDVGPSVAAPEDEEPLNSGDDVSEAEEDVFDCPDLLVCQYDKVNRAKAKWRFSFRDAVLQSGFGRREYLFSRITGEAEFS